MSTQTKLILEAQIADDAVHVFAKKFLHSVLEQLFWGC